MKVLHLHQKKSGGTSVNMSIMEALYKKDAKQVYSRLVSFPLPVYVHKYRVVIGWNRRLIGLWLHNFAFTHQPSWRLHIPPKKYVFTILRSPIERVYSRYRHLKSSQESGMVDGLENEISKIGESFYDYLVNTEPKNIATQLYCFSRTYDISEAIGNLGICKRVFFQSDMNRVFEVLSSDLELNLQPLRFKRNKDISIHDPEDVIRARNHSSTLRQYLDLEEEFYRRAQEIYGTN